MALKPKLNVGGNRRTLGEFLHQDAGFGMAAVEFVLKLGYELGDIIGMACLDEGLREEGRPVVLHQLIVVNARATSSNQPVAMFDGRIGLKAGIDASSECCGMINARVTRQGDFERARRLMADVFPELLDDGLELAVTELESALIFAAILNANGEMQRRDVLLLALEERIGTMHRTRGVGYGILDVYIHVMRGDRDRAVASLREAIDVGWRVSGSFPAGLTEDGCWWMLRQDWKLANLHRDPEFIAMVNELEADIRAQRQWFEENKDKPLF